MRCLIPLAASATAISVRIAAPCHAGTVPWGDGTCEPFAAAKRDALKWLRKNAPPSDLRNAATLFGTPGGVDGLDAGVAAVAANATLTAKMRWPWAWGVPRDIFRDYVLPYACANEPRTHWHGLLAKAVEPILDALPRHASIADVASAINGYGGNSSVWQNVGGVRFHSGQTPLIFDPVSTVAFGYASCTGVSTTYIAALRVAGPTTASAKVPPTSTAWSHAIAATQVSRRDWSARQRGSETPRLGTITGSKSGTAPLGASGRADRRAVARR